MVDFTQLIIWIISTVAIITTAVLGAKVIPFLREKGFYSFVALMVKAATTYFLDGQGREKFDWVFSKVDEKYGKWFDVEAIKNAIQSAYVDMCIALGKTPAPSKTGDEDEEET